MVDIYRSNNPADYDDVDGIVVDESAPAPSIAGVAANVAILVGQFERGPDNELTSIGSTAALHELFGKGFSGNNELKQRKFGRLKVIRAVAAAAAKGTKTFQDSTPANSITFEALYKGAYGNGIKVTIETGTASGKKYTIEDTGTNAVLLPEIYDNIVVTGKTQAQLDAIFGASKLVKAVSVPAVAEPANATATALASGSDGTIADGDYEDAIEVAKQLKAGNILWLDSYNATKRGYLKQHVLDSPDKMVVLGMDDETEDDADAITAAGLNRDTEGRIILAFNHIEIQDGASKVWTSAASWIASILSNTSPHIDPGWTQNVKFTTAGLRVKYAMDRAKYIALKEAGIAAFEQDPDLAGSGICLVSGITTCLTATKVMILRRRMADYLTDSIALYLKNFKGAPNTAANRRDVKGAIVSWDDSQIRAGILPGDADVQSGSPRMIDTESLNTNDMIAAGFFKIIFKRRIFSSMRYIVLVAEIGESVIVTEE